MKDRTIFFENGPRAILLFHAFTSTPNDMRSLARALERENYTVYAPTLSGHGTENPDDIFKFGIDQWKKDGEKAYDSLKQKGYQEIAVFGLSLGGVIATHLMLNRDVKVAGVFASPVVPNGETHVPENFMLWYQAMKVKAGHTEQEIAQMKPIAEDKLAKILNNLNEFVVGMEPSYDSVEKSVFIAQGGNDEMIDSKLAENYRDELVHAEVDFHWYEDAPHVLTTGKAGKALQADFLPFLNKLNWR